MGVARITVAVREDSPTASGGVPERRDGRAGRLARGRRVRGGAVRLGGSVAPAFGLGAGGGRARGRARRLRG